jgi:predicted HicB family RNase H-like nuclease
MADAPPGVVTTTVRLPRKIHQQVAEAAETDRRSFNNELIALVEVALAGRAPVKAERR